MKTWNWQQPGNRVWKVISDYKAGTIKVYDEKGKLLMKRKDLSEKAIKIIEKNFFDVVAPSDKNVLIKPKNDPMFV